jgi:hypothetical protein
MMNETSLRLALAHLEKALQALEMLPGGAAGESQLVRRAESNLVYASQALEESLTLAQSSGQLVGVAI